MSHYLFGMWDINYFVFRSLEIWGHGGTFKARGGEGDCPLRSFPGGWASNELSVRCTASR